MNIKDKMKLLFEDSNIQAETDGKESVLTPQERKAIIDDARTTGEIRQLRETNELYITANFVSIDMEIANLFLYFTISQLEKILMGIVLKGTAEDVIGQMLYDLASEEKKKPLDIESELKELRKKYKVDSLLFKGFDFFSPPDNDGNNESTGFNSQGLTPNENLQKLFMASFYRARKLKKKLYEMSYIMTKAPVDFLPSSTKNSIKDSEEILALFTGLEDTLKPLRVYRDFGSRFSSNTVLIEPKFLETIQNLSENLELTKEEKTELEARLDKSLEKDLY